MGYSYIVIDADINLSKNIEEYLENYPVFKLLKIFRSIYDAIKEILEGKNWNTITIDIIFLAADSSRYLDLNLVRKLKEKCLFIVLFATERSLAADAFDVGIKDFCKFPVSEKRFKDVMERFYEQQRSGNPSLFWDDSFFFADEVESGLKMKCYYREIIAVESDGNHIRILTSFKTYIVSFTMKAMDEILSRKNYFVRIQRSYIISLHHVAYIGQSEVKMENLVRTLSIGDSYKERFNAIIDELSLQNLKDANDKPV